MGYHCIVRIVTAETMRALDRRAMEEGGIPGVVLMENAGRAVFEFLADRYGPAQGRAFCVLCGTGNNGGDGFVAARHLKLAGAQVAVELVGDPERIKGDARVHFEIMTRMGLRPGPPAPNSGGDGRGAVVVDALLGTGIQGAPRGETAEAIRRINAAPGPVIAVDIPSGVDSDTGATPGEAVRAAATVTFAYPKLGMFLAPGALCVGELIVRDIGFAWEALRPQTPYRWIRPEEVYALLPRRAPDAHKGDFGHVLVVGGSTGMGGAAAMTAMAALRAGAGLVTAAAPESAQRLIASRRDEVMTLPLPEKDGALCEASFEAIGAMAERCDVLCLGPGATQQSEAQAFIIRVLKEVDKPIVLDADGLNALARFPDALNGRTAPAILTPHPGECGRLIGRETGGVQADRVGAVRQTAERYRAVVALKGWHTLVCDGRIPPPAPPSQEGTPPPPYEGGGRGEVRLPVAVNTTGNPGMATGGSGDSLTGIIGALLAQGLDAFDAACAGVYLHGRAGDIAAAEKGQIALVAGDIIKALPRAMTSRPKILVQMREGEEGQ
jgi:hydroxyethylthiazole kinase-like uncharacterized protein yjeF